MNPIKKKYTDDLCDILYAEILDCEDGKYSDTQIVHWLKLLLDEGGRKYIWEK